MITYHLRHTGPLARPGRLSRLDLTVAEELTVRDLVRHLLQRGDLIGRPEEYAAEPEYQFLVVVNGLPLRELGGPDLLLRDGDSVAILVPALGG
jgi:molybdopterin converting factor small subunit